VRKLAAATLLAKRWPGEARRDKATGALTGALLREGYSLPDVKRLITAVVEAAKDPRARLRADAVDNAAKRLNNKAKVSGWPTLEKVFGPEVTAQLKYWLEPDCARVTSAAAPGGGSNGVVSLPQFEAEYQANPVSHVVDGLIPDASVNIGVGDSGLGKSPWGYQMGLCVASGIPFLGRQVKQGRVLYVDLENGRGEIFELIRSLRRHLELLQPPADFYPTYDHSQVERLEPLIQQIGPALVIVDSLRALRPEAEGNNENAAKLMNELRQIARAYNTAFFVIHHIKKPNDNFPSGALEDTPTMKWLLQASGARSLINQTDVRIGFDKTSGIRVTTLQKGDAKRKSDQICLIVKGFARLRGEFGPLFLATEYDEEGTPLGYRALAGLELLFNAEQEAAFRKLPNQFTFKEAKHAYGRRDQATTDWLQKLQRIDVLTHVKGGLYTKVPEYAEHGE
jgi:hypothetical protein